MLVERPTALTEEARAEEVQKAVQQMSDRNESFTRVKKEIGTGMEMSGRYRGTGGDIRISVDKGVDIPRPQHTLADPE